MSKKIILHFSQDFAPGKVQLGGYSRIINLCNDDNIHIIFTFSNTHEEINERLINKIRVISLPINARGLGRLQQIKLLKPTVNQISNFLNKENVKVDILFGHSQLINFAILYYLNQKIKVKVPLIWEANAIWGIHSINGLLGFLVNQFNKYFQKRVFILADHIVAQTEASKHFINRVFKIPLEKILIVENAINIKLAPPTKTDFPKRYRVKILCTGLFDEMNGIPFLIEFLNKHQFEAIQFFFIGDGKYRSVVEDLAKKGLCTYLGSIPYQQMLYEYSNYDFIIIPRLAQKEAELFIPTKLIEAMYYGLIPICSKVKAMEEVVQEDITGFLFEPSNSDSLKVVLDTVMKLTLSRREEISKGATNRVLSDFNWEKNHEQLNIIYRSSNDD